MGWKMSKIILDRNELSRGGNGSGTTTYSYDITGTRLQKKVGTAASSNRTPTYTNTTGSLFAAGSTHTTSNPTQYTDTYTPDIPQDWCMAGAAWKPTSATSTEHI
jgi:hypothetical protein